MDLLLQLNACAYSQGRQMVMFGGEHDIQQDENAKPKQGKEADSDEETSTEILNDISLLEADSSMWIDIPISGATCS